MPVCALVNFWLGLCTRQLVTCRILVCMCMCGRFASCLCVCVLICRAYGLAAAFGAPALLQRAQRRLVGCMRAFRYSRRGVVLCFGLFVLLFFPFCAPSLHPVMPAASKPAFKQKTSLLRQSISYYAKTLILYQEIETGVPLPYPKIRSPPANPILYPVRLLAANLRYRVDMSTK